MANRFLRLDLAANARDFEPVAMEPGLPLLDKSNANFRVLRKWLGRLIAEPVWTGNSVELFVCDEQEGRLVDVRCEPATADDLRRNRGLAEDFDELQRRLEAIQPEPREAKLRDAIIQHFGKLTGEAGPAQKECHFFKYLDGGSWRLVWGWGYQRKDLAPASPTICTNPSCSLLFVRFSEGSRNCPACEAGVAGRSPARRKSWLPLVATMAAIALVAGVLGYVFRDYIMRGGGGTVVATGSLLAKPPSWSGRVGGQVQFQVLQQLPDGKQKDVTGQVVTVIENPKVLRLDSLGGVVHARSSGKTVIAFYFDDKEAHATVEVQAAKNPLKISLDPPEATLGVGTTAQLRVRGEFEGGGKQDLTDTAEWEPVAGGGVYCHQGRIEGISKGEAVVAVRYRATAADPYLRAEAKLAVVEEKYKSLELKIQPSDLAEGRSARLEADVVNEAGKSRSVLNSSQLTMKVDPPGIGVLDGGSLRGLAVGQGKWSAAFHGLSASREFRVQSAPTKLYVKPNPLALAVGETCELQVVGGGTAPIRVVSSAPEIVEASGRRLVGRAAGKAVITVSQESQRETIEAEVTPANVTSIAFVPSRISLPVDGSLALRLVGRGKGGEEIDLAPERINWEQVPTPAFAELDVKTLEIHGHRPTGETPQPLAARYGQLRATAQVDVVTPPLEIELTPAGPVPLPVSQVAQLHAWARYGGGRRVELSPQQLQWKVDPPEVAGIELTRPSATVRATKAGVGPLNVRASYQGFDSNVVQFRSVEGDVVPTLDCDRSLILVNDAGLIKASAADGASSGLSLEGVRFESSAPKVLSVNPQTGEYRALAPGAVTVRATHPRAKAPATRDLQVFTRDDAKLLFRPAEIRLTVDGRQPLSLYLAVGGREEKLSLSGGALGARLDVARPDAVRWAPPMLIGQSPAPPFEVAASYAGKTARATVEVLLPPADGKAAIRLVPAAAKLAPQQPLSLHVEQRLPGAGDAWQQVDSSKVKWSVPKGVVWTRPDNDLPPQVMLAEPVQGPSEIGAEYAGSKAALTIEPKKDLPSGPLVVVREPEGDCLAVGSRQRYVLMHQNQELAEPAVGVQWQPAFENDYVRWDPPVLTAKREGHEQRLTASVGEQRVEWATRTVGRSGPPVAPSPSGEKPAEVRIASDQQPPIVIPVRGEFADFRVEAVFAGGLTRDVTPLCTLRIDCDNPQQPPLAVEQGRLSAQQPGKATLQAEYNGVKSSQGLAIEVVKDAELTALEIVPSSVEVRLHGTAKLRVNAYRGSGRDRKLLGDITDRPDLDWKSDAPDVVQVEGPSVTGLSPGKARVTVVSGRASAAAEVQVPAVASTVRTVLEPKSLRLKAGETKWIGTDVVLRDGGADISDQFQATSSAPSIVRYNRNNRSIEGVSPGEADLAVTVVGLSDTIHVLVDPPDSEKGTIVIEPAAGALAVGEGQDLHVILVTDGGQRIDRTGSAVMASGDEHVLSVAGSRIVGVAAGRSAVTARLPGIAEPGKASFSVTDEQFTEIRVIPQALHLTPGEERPIQIVGIGPAGRRELSDHPDLKVTIGGESPGAIQWRGDGNVRGVAPGKAALGVQWRGLAAAPVPVEVSGDVLKMLRIEPRDPTVAVGNRISFLVYAMQGDRERCLSADDGVEIQTADPSVAKPGRDLSVLGVAPGATEVTAQCGAQRAVAVLHVVPRGPSELRHWTGLGSIPRGPSELQPSTGLRFIPDILTLQLGVPGASVRVVKVLPDGQEEDVDHRAKIEITNPDVCEVQWTATGPVFVAKKEGRTEATASQGELTTLSPLEIRVVQGGPARLEVHPDPLELNLGQAGGFRRVRLVPAGDGLPVDVDYRVQTKDPKIVGVEGGKMLRGLSAGRAEVTVAPVGVGQQYAGLRADVSVDVAGTPPPIGLQLVLTGPSQTTVGAAVNYQVQLTGGGAPTDVTNDGAELVLQPEHAPEAEVGPGCSLAAKKAGQITVRARRGELISNPIELRIDPLDKSLVRLELEIDRQPLFVGESRSYRVWGYPAGDAPRQDLTASVGAADQAAGGPQTQVILKVADPPGGEIVAHNPPTLVAKSPGPFKIVATYKKDPQSERLQSEVVDVDILPPPIGPVDLTAVPSLVTIRVGQQTPPIQVLASQPGAPGRQVDVQWSSEDESLLAPDPQNPAHFVGKAAGKTRLKATRDKQAVFVDVNVIGGTAFDEVTVEGQPDLQQGSRFAAFVNVKGAGQGSAGWEYRAVTVDNPEEGAWKAATVDGNVVRIRLTSPPIREGPPDTEYHLVIEARDKEHKIIGRYPLTFKLNINITNKSN
jgi:hypothetical protein